MIGVLGSGSWATSIVKVLQEKDNGVINWWVLEPEVRDSVRSEGRNPLYLSDVQLDKDRLYVSNDVQEIINKSNDVYVVIPSAFLQGVMEKVSWQSMVGKNFITAVKGLIPSTHQTVSEFLNLEIGINADNIAVISGPTHAEEVSKGKKTFLAVASSNRELSLKTQQTLACDYLTPIVYDDVKGIEWAAVLKNIYAIAGGLTQGPEGGDNLTAVMVTAVLDEMAHFLQIISPSLERRIHDFPYLGDLLVTCWSKHSRNRTLGEALANGTPLSTAISRQKMVAEGYFAVKSLKQIIDQRNISMPIVRSVYTILYEHVDIKEEIDRMIKNLL